MTTDTDQLMNAMRKQLRDAGEVVAWLEAHLDTVVQLGESLLKVLEAGGTIWTAGNGGSATHAMHLAEELLGRYRQTRRPLASACLHADPSALTCIANDFGYASVFSRSLEGLGRSGDALVVLSTSGKSENILKALEMATAMDIRTIGLLGRDGGPALMQCEQSIVVPFEDSATIQEGHHLVLHLLCELIDAAYTD
jgi:D-sedoheptulose 7-phosphate isomerase